MTIRMAYEVVMSYHLHMPSYFLGTFTEYPFLHTVVIRSVELDFTVKQFGASPFPGSYTGQVLLL